MWTELEQNKPLDLPPHILQSCPEVNKTKYFFQNKISDKSFTEIKHTLYVAILKIILNDFYPTPSPGIFVKIIWKSQIRSI